MLGKGGSRQEIKIVSNSNGIGQFEGSVIVYL